MQGLKLNNVIQRAPRKECVNSLLAELFCRHTYIYIERQRQRETHTVYMIGGYWTYAGSWNPHYSHISHCTRPRSSRISRLVSRFWHKFLLNGSWAVIRNAKSCKSGKLRILETSSTASLWNPRSWIFVTPRIIRIFYCILPLLKDDDNAYKIVFKLMKFSYNNSVYIFGDQSIMMMFTSNPHSMSISWLLIPWLLASPGHQQPWYWLCKTNRPLFSMRKDFNCHFYVEERDININTKLYFKTIQRLTGCNLPWN